MPVVPMRLLLSSCVSLLTLPARIQPTSRLLYMMTEPAQQQQHCVPCSTLDASHRLDPQDVELQLQGTWWKVSQTSSQIDCITRTFTARHFQAALDSLNAMGQIAECENHHPDFHLTGYRNVQVDIYTHTLQGITKNDILLARMLDDKVSIDYSPKWLQSQSIIDSNNKNNNQSTNK
jgi:4a-hydroxytetrahydrobiopterin dehydratase